MYSIKKRRAQLPKGYTAGPFLLTFCKLFLEATRRDQHRHARGARDECGVRHGRRVLDPVRRLHLLRHADPCLGIDRSAAQSGVVPLLLAKATLFPSTSGRVLILKGRYPVATGRLPLCEMKICLSKPDLWPRI